MADSVEGSLSLLVMSARVSPPLRDAVATVETHVRTLEGIAQRLLDGWERDFENRRWIHLQGWGNDDYAVYAPMSPAEVAWFTEHQEVNGG